MQTRQQLLTNGLVQKAFVKSFNVPPLPMLSMLVMSLIHSSILLSVPMSMSHRSSMRLRVMMLLCLLLKRRMLTTATITTKHPTQSSAAAAMSMSQIMDMLILVVMVLLIMVLLQLVLQEISSYRPGSGPKHTVVMAAAVTKLFSEEVPACAADEGGA